LAQVPANVPPEQYRAYYLEKYARETARRDLQHLCACFQWGVSQKLTESNPLQSPGNPIKVTRRGNSRAAFSQAERDQILAAFQGDIFKSPYSKVPHSYYFDFVWFLFHTGCRLEDAVGLRWEHISPDFSRINFCSAIPSGYRVPGTPKTGARVFDCKRIAGLQEFLRDRRTRINSPWVFPSVTGRPIHADNFGRRIWKPIVERLVAEGRVEKYLPAYHCRHSFISHCRWAGVSPEEIAAMVGNSPEVIFRHYSVAPKNLAPISL
jgi:integrase